MSVCNNNTGGDAGVNLYVPNLNEARAALQVLADPAACLELRLLPALLSFVIRGDNAEPSPKSSRNIPRQIQSTIA